MSTPKPSVWLSTVIVVALAALWSYLRLGLFGENILPLTFVLPLLVTVWTRRPWQLWMMAASFVAMMLVKIFWILPADKLTGADDWTFLGATLANIVIGVAAVLMILNLRDRLDARNQLITAQNAELEQQAEELSQQNEEIRAQSEELTEQNEELESQAEELTRQNEELGHANHRIISREEILHGLLSSSHTADLRSNTMQELCRRTLALLGDPAMAVAMLWRNGDPSELHLEAHSTQDGATPLPHTWPIEGSIGKVVLEQNRTAYVADLTQLVDGAAPFDGLGAVRSVLGTPVRFAGEPAGVLVACSDAAAHWTDEQFRVMEWVAAQCGLITEAWRAQQALAKHAQEVEAANRAKDNFLAALSHELRMPLTPVLMTAAALCVDERLPEEVREQIRMIERNIGLEARLIDDLLDLSRITKGKLKMRPQLCDAHSLIAFAVDIVRDEVREKGITLEQDLSAEKSGLQADPSRFQQVIWNLLRNAVKFTPAGGRITIRTREEASSENDAPRLRIEITDSGIGIAPAEFGRIFEPFEQGTDDHDHRFGGLGLGLAISRAIVHLHGGSISAKSEGQNCGATFVVILPGATAPPPGIGAASSNRTDSGGRKTGCTGAAPLRLLVVEDHEATLQVLTRLLIRAGHKVTAVSSVSAALAEAAAQPFDGVVSDLGLPDGTGNELMEKLHQMYGLRGIALSGYGMEEDLERSQKAGFIAHLVKPIDFAQLSEALLALSVPPEHRSAHDAASGQVQGAMN